MGEIGILQLHHLTEYKWHHQLKLSALVSRIEVFGFIFEQSEKVDTHWPSLDSQWFNSLVIC